MLSTSVADKFRQLAIKEAQNNNSPMVFMAHAMKVLLKDFDEVSAVFAQCNAVDLGKYQIQLDKQIKTLPKVKEQTKIEISPKVEAIIDGAALASGSYGRITELHLAVEAISIIIDSDEEDYDTLSTASGSPMDLRGELKAIIAGETLSNLEDVKPSNHDRDWFTEQEAPLVNKFVGNDIAVQKIINATNTSGGCIAALVGDKSAGKSATMDAFNFWLHNSSEPKAKQRIIRINADELIHYINQRGTLESAVISAISECTNSNAILYIDNIHYLNDAFKDYRNPPLLPIMSLAADKGISIVCSISTDTFPSIFEKKGYREIVQRIDIPKPSEDEIAEILRSTANDLSNQHFIVYLDEAISELTRLSLEYFKKNRLHHCITILKLCTKTHDNDVVDTHVIHKAISAIKGITIGEVSSSTLDKLQHISERIKADIFGQDNAIDEICEQVRSASIGLKINEKQPRASFMLLGSSGVGKTETTELLAKQMNEQILILNMGEYQESHSVSKLLGAPPGYVGHDKGDGALAEFISANPNGIIVFDEIEKAHPRLFDLLLGVMDKGALTTNTQKDVDFSGNIIFFTSNCGANTPSNSFGLRQQTSQKTVVDRTVFERTFKPEFRNRLSAIIDYKTLSDDDLYKITLKSIRKLSEKALSKYGLNITVDEPTVMKIAKKYFMENMGARPIERGVEAEIGRKITNAILSNKAQSKNIKFLTEGDEIKMKAA